jgi:hypothetical protein
LYNLAADIGERNNLADKSPDRVRDLHEKLKAWRQNVGAKMPVANPDHDSKTRWKGLAWHERCSAGTPAG